jgi:hypothetical protein
MSVEPLCRGVPLRLPLKPAPAPKLIGRGLARAGACETDESALPRRFYSQRIDGAPEGRSGSSVVMTLFNASIKAARSLGPYLLIELLVPGGSLVALALWWYRTMRATTGRLAKT